MGSQLKIVEQAITAFSQSLNDEDKNLFNPALVAFAALTHYVDNDGDKSLLLTLPQEQRALIDEYLNIELPI